ncbi:MAG: bifunctional [glutamate--ammonia ligase]-adenylyl-L-tyrosine phosphorylase/[glutamate--ammonia-ligase] adenylyltransferase [Porticoccaceae bacterium]|nr:bifunctional [glutamate--ammonia ligase]-adenylyl-L-tyrosine phosphorylase/[glutamate--ammonia-ligase] adenylyltransferase [Porticoccaceae bacterium]
MATPTPLVQQSYQATLQRYLDADSDPAWLQQLLTNPQFAQQLELVWGCSDFVADQATIDSVAFRQLLESGDLQSEYSENQYLKALQFRVEAMPDSRDEEALGKQLRLFRRREMIRIIWRDFTRLATLSETTRDVTLLAEACVNTALDYLHQMVVEDLGVPVGPSGNEQRMLVIAMGKMGGCELNISSDIDLIFAYPQAGETRVARRPVSNQEFFVRLGQKLIAALDAQTADGFVFRVDMRLRPYGQSGPLVQNFAALKEYYLTQGRGWERYAMVKARVVAGSAEDAKTLREMLHPFIYRRYLDYGAIEALRDLKRKINLEVARKGMHDNIKLGRGGIRELEFIVQSLQLIRGGRLKALQIQSLQLALEQLASEGLLSASDKNQLWGAYQFLRNSEHVLQAMGDKQTQQLPVDPLSQQRLATVMGEASWQDFKQQLELHRQLVYQCFSSMIAEGDQPAVQDAAGEELLWRPEMDADEALSAVQRLNYQQPEEIANRLQQFYNSRAVLGLDSLPRTRLDALMPKLLQTCAAQEDCDTTFNLLLNLVQAVLRRSVYLSLLLENTQALEQLALLCQRSSWIADQLTAYPALLDELLDSRNLYAIQEKRHLRDQLRQQTLRIAYDDQEQQMEEMRYFVRACTLRIAACEITNLLPLMEASDQLTWIAEVVVEHIANVAWHQMAEKYGVPKVESNSSGDSETPGFIVVAYGKMGGIEMGYKSDLDLVFLHDNLSGQTLGGPESIDSSVFFMRLGRRIIHMLSTSTHAGRAYEIDMRLRPSGNSGMLVSNLNAFEKYQRESAWTWEHQALVRSRVIAGDKNTAQHFTKIRSAQLRRHRDLPTLRNDVTEMRRKMRKHLDKSTKDHKYSLKQASGGIVDIEFMVQFAVLAWSHQYDQLTHWTDTVRLLETMARCGLIGEQTAQRLMDAYRTYRSAVHALQLQNRPAEMLLSEFCDERKAVETQWQYFFDNYKKEE